MEQKNNGNPGVRSRLSHASWVRPVEAYTGLAPGFMRAGGEKMDPEGVGHLGQYGCYRILSNLTSGDSPGTGPHGHDWNWALNFSLTPSSVVVARARSWNSFALVSFSGSLVSCPQSR